MFRAPLTIAAGIALGANALNASHQHHDDGEKVKVLSTTDIKEKLDGKEAVATVVEVTIEPGRSGVPHRHPGSAIGTGWCRRCDW
jgi:quercetin dioxygenase-like cupin family protein